MSPKDSTTEEQQQALRLRQERVGQLRQKVDQLRRKLGQKAKAEPGFRFYALYDRIYRLDVLEVAFWSVARKGGAAGADGVTVDQIVNAEDGPAVLIAALHEELRTKTYRPQPVKRVYIPKANGKMRPLGIPAVRDRVVQTAALLILEPIFEADFLPESYGFRPARSAHGAVEAIQSHLKQGFTEVYDADLKAYFDTIPHDKLIKGLEQRIADGAVLHLIRLWLTAPVKEQGKPLTRPTMGTPQGGVISPLLANSYLHWFDRKLMSRLGPGTSVNARLVRYADDFVVMARWIGPQIVGFIEETIEQRLGLVLNREKTKIVRVKELGESLEFLGYIFRRERSLTGQGTYVRVEASPKALARLRDAIRESTGPQWCFMPIPDMVVQVTRQVRGWLNYFSVGHPSRVKRKVVQFTEWRLVRHLHRRSQRPFKPPKGTDIFAHVRALGAVFP